jgi:hypothetical protein
MRKTILLLVLCFMAVSVGLSSGSEQPANVASTDDYDVIEIPVARALSSEPGGGDFRFGGVGLSVIPVDNYPLGAIIEQGDDTITFRLQSGEEGRLPQAVRLWSDPIPLSDSSISFSSIVSVSGERPGQAGGAFIDAGNMLFLSAALSYNNELPVEEDLFFFEYQSEADRAHLLIQFVGPAQGVSEVTIKRLRVFSGGRELDFALGATQVSPVVHFGADQTVMRVVPPSTAGGRFAYRNDANRTVFPGAENQALLLESDSHTDVIQVALPLEPILDPNASKQVYGEAYIKRISGEEGIFTIALYSGQTGSGGYTDIPIASIPVDTWLRVETPVRFSGEGKKQPLLILQNRFGEAQILVDDVSLKARKDSIYFWRSNSQSQ